MHLDPQGVAPRSALDQPQQPVESSHEPGYARGDGDVLLLYAPERQTKLPGARWYDLLVVLWRASTPRDRAPGPDEWMAADESLKLAAIEAYHRALGAVVPSNHSALDLIVEN